MSTTLRYALAVVAGTVLLLTGLVPRGARAAHDNGAQCYDCHALNANSIQQGTASMSTTAMAEIKARGWVPGMRLGCTFCHRSVNAASMPDVLSSFSGATPPGASRHPVARNYRTGSFDNVPFLSGDNTFFDEHLDCRDCHDVTLVSYPNHDNTTWLNDSGPAGRTKSTNPYALRGVTSPKAYDGLCRSCHAGGAAFSAFTGGKSAAGGVRIALVSHDNAVDNAANAIRDIDNTHLRTQDAAEQAAGRQCSVCHDAHESQNLHLFSDSHEKDATGASEVPIFELVDCTTVCHYPGDAQGNYDTHGHGKPTDYAGISLARDCTFCHDAGTPHNMRNFATDNNYFRKYRFQSFDQSWVTPSVYGKPVKSVCANCHVKSVHYTKKGNVGCLDCHDQHAKSSDTNVMMVRNLNRVAGSVLGVTGVGASSGTESVLFAKSRLYPAGDNVFHYFTNVAYGATGTDNGTPGFCDQRACHGAGTKDGVPYIPMNTYLASGVHSGGPISSYNIDCEGCHGHNDTGGSFRAVSACTLCHGQPPPPQDSSSGEVYIYNEYLSPHRVHAGSQASGNYGISCQKCHYSYTSGSTHNTTPKTFQSLVFDNAIRRGAAGYDNSTLACTNIYCHSDGRGGNPVTAPVWFNPAQPTVAQKLGCGDCHSVAMTSGAHTQHLAIAGVNCSACHVSTVNDNGTALNPTTGIQYHVNKTIDVTIKAAYDIDGNPLNNYDNATKTCSQVVCHGGNTTTSWIPPVPGTCDVCHSYVGGVPVTTNTYDYTFSGGLGVMSKVALGNFQTRGHGDNNGLPWDNSSVPALVCTACHVNGATEIVPHDCTVNPFRFKTTISGRAVQPDNVNSLCTACHTNSATRSDAHSNGVTGGGQSNVPPRPFTHSQKCVDCHDVHGQTNIQMIYDNLAAQVDNAAYASSDAYGKPLYPGARVPVVFTARASGSDYASIDNSAPFNGICEVCHTRTMQFRNASGAYSGRGPGGAHPNRVCSECHRHGTGTPAIAQGGGFAGVGGNNVEQFLDNALRVASATNYNDRSRHAVSEHPTNLTYAPEVDCLRCHGVSPLPQGGQRSNECLKCHYERRQGVATYHPNGQFEWAIPSNPANPFGAAGPATYAFCIQCHGPGGSGSTLNGLSPDNVIPTAETWGGGSGHGATSRLSSDNAVGPPAYDCRDCHYSSAAAGTSSSARDNNAPTFHGSINRKMVGNDNIANPEYPHPGDAVYTSVDARSGRMDSFCATLCHGNLSNGQAKDDAVVRHTWEKLGGETQGGTTRSHPSDAAPTPGARYRAPDNLPLSENIAGAPPAGSGNVVCVTCHNPHGGPAGLVDKSGPLSGGNKQMMRRSFKDNTSTICKECHL